MHIHILGICGTFMGGLAVIARQLGHTVSGADVNFYPPISTQLESLGIPLVSGYGLEHLMLKADLILIGNTLRRGTEAIEYILNNDLPYMSGPEWLRSVVLRHCHVVAVAGTHGKTTTTGMLMWMLQQTGFDPGFLCGGVPNNFNISARVGKSPFFVIEADEYDTAFFDKRSKFVHYHPRTLIINNIEFDHADIFRDLVDVKRQFSHLLRTLPSEGIIVFPSFDDNVKEVLTNGCWTPTTAFNCRDPEATWHAENINTSVDGNEFEVWHHNSYCGTVKWQLLGDHNVNNALAAIAAISHIDGISIQAAITALCDFTGIKRRLEVIGTVRDITVYDDFAHHPTAVAATISGLRSKIDAVGGTTFAQPKITVAIELASNSMSSGVYGEQLITALNGADEVHIMHSKAKWDLEQLLQNATIPMTIGTMVDEIIERVAQTAQAGDHIVIMSNKDFGGIHQKLLQRLTTDYAT